MVIAAGASMHHLPDQVLASNIPRAPSSPSGAAITATPQGPNGGDAEGARWPSPNCRHRPSTPARGASPLPSLLSGWGLEPCDVYAGGGVLTAVEGGKPTFDRVVRGLRVLQAHGVRWNALTTINHANEGHPLEVYRFLRDDLGAQFIQFIPIVERPSPGGIPEGDPVTDRSVSPGGYGAFLSAVFDEWVRRDVGNVFVKDVRHRDQQRPGRRCPAA